MAVTRGQELQIEGLYKRYGETVALQDMTFAVQPGELFGFVGSNGAGKTTAMRIALGVLSADSGHVYLGGQPIDLSIRRRIGYMPEERGLYPKMKVGLQLSYLAQLHGLSTGDAADAVTSWTTRLGINNRVNDTVDSLSLGNQQRVQLAAALVHDPDVLVLDEPFAGLDPVAVDVRREVPAEKAAHGVPVIYLTHPRTLRGQPRGRARPRARPLVEYREPLAYPLDSCAPLVLREYERTDVHVLRERQGREDVLGLRNEVEPASGQEVGAQTGDVFAGEAHRPTAPRDQAVDRFEHRRLAGAVRPDHRDDLVCVRRERHAIQDEGIVVSGLECVDLEEAHVAP